MITSKTKLKEYIEADSLNYLYQNQSFLRVLHVNFIVNPISDQKYIWKYIKTLRQVEYLINTKKNIIVKLYYLYKLRKYSYITSFQIPPFTVGKGMRIWHWGPIIINPNVKIGNNCTLNPNIIIGHKSEGEAAPIIGNNVFIGANTTIIGSIKIGDNVIIAPSSCIYKDIPNNCVVGGNPAKILKENK